MRLLLEPQFHGDDHKGDGGIRRVAEAQMKYLPSYGIDIVRTEEEADIVALHAGVFARTQKPIVAHCHGLYWMEQDWPAWARKMNRDVARNIVLADAVTVPSRWVYDAVSTAFWVDPYVFYHGVDPDEWIPEEEDEGYILWNKTRVDQVCTLEEIETLARKFPNLQFVSTYGSQLLPNLTATGRMSYNDAKRSVKKAAVYLATSRETFGIGVLEAMAAGVPVLSWNWGGQAEIIKHKETGYLAEPGNYDDLAQGLMYCLTHQKVLGTEARQDVLDRWTWEQKIEQYADLYNNVGRNRRGTVAVVVPCYNLGRYLKQAVESVVAEADEVIIVDDASTDNTRDVALELCNTHSNVRLIRHPDNLHVATTLNDGIASTHSDYIVPLDADNWIPQRALTTLKEALDADRTVDIVYGKVQFTDEFGVPKKEVGPNGISSWPGEFRYRGPHLYPEAYCPSTSMFRKRVWQRTAGYRTRYKGVEDADFWTRATSIGFLAKKATDAITLVYRIRDDSLSHTETRVDWTKWYPKLPPVPCDGPINISMRDPIISVVIPVGAGHEKYVLDAVDSIWNQTFQNWECIVVSDTTEHIRLPPFVRFLSTLHSGLGPSVARNVGIANARGRYIYFLDADDYAQPTALAELYKSVGDGYAYSDWVDDEGIVYNTPDCACERLVEECPIGISLLYPRTANIRFDETLERWEDWDFYLRLETAGYGGTRVAKPLYRYRRSLGSRGLTLYNDELRERWPEYFNGVKKLACGACGKPKPQELPTGALAPSGDTVLIDYIGPSSGTRTYRGKVSGRLYRFGANTNHRTKYVLKDDAPFLLELVEFREHVDDLVLVS